MTFKEKKLYHQIHPVKLFTDISTSVVSLYLFWYHHLIVSLVVHILLPIIGTFLVIRFADLENQKKSSFGNYIRKYMTVWIEAIRFVGDIATVLGAWYHQSLLIIIGLIIILLGWFNGLLFSTGQKHRDYL